MTLITLQRIGHSVGIELPDNMRARMNMKPGDALMVSESGDGSLRPARAAPNHDEQMRLAREGMREYQIALRELAK